MMRLTVVAIGRARHGPERALWEHYAGRIRWPVTLREIEERRRSGDAREREADLLLRAVPKNAPIVVLDEVGEMLDSRTFANRLANWAESGSRECAFLIGGAMGHAPRVRAAADLVLSLGAMTWPHLLVRGLLAEQLYRAQQIIAGHPYHRD